MNNNALLRLQVRIQQAWIDIRDNEHGQTMVEYAGIALVAAAIIVAVISAIGDSDGGIGSAITTKISDTISSLTGK